MPSASAASSALRSPAVSIEIERQAVEVHLLAQHVARGAGRGA